MPLLEKFDSRSFSVELEASRITLKYSYIGSENETIVHADIQAGLPPTYVLGLRTLFLHDFEAEPLGGGNWDVTANYGIVDINESVFNLDTTGATVHITQSLEVVSKTPVGAPDVDGAIGFDGDRVNGTDVPIPRYAWNEQHRVLAANWTAAYRNKLFQLTATYNNAVFRGFNAGEVIFLGVTASQRGNHDVDATYYFEAEPNLTNLSVGSLTVPTKLGQHYLDVRYKKVEDAANNRVRTTPDFAYVHRLLTGADMAQLGIGTA